MAWIILIIILGIAVAIALSDGKQINADNGNETGRTTEYDRRLVRDGDTFREVVTEKDARKTNATSKDIPTFSVYMETPYRRKPDPRCLRPVRGLKEYVPIYSSAFLPPEHQLDLVTIFGDGKHKSEACFVQRSTCIGSAQWDTAEQSFRANIQARRFHLFPSWRLPLRGSPPGRRHTSFETSNACQGTGQPV